MVKIGHSLSLSQFAFPSESEPLKIVSTGHISVHVFRLNDFTQIDTPPLLAPRDAFRIGLIV